MRSVMIAMLIPMASCNASGTASSKSSGFPLNESTNVSASYTEPIVFEAFIVADIGEVIGRHAVGRLQRYPRLGAHAGTENVLASTLLQYDRSVLRWARPRPRPRARKTSRQLLVSTLFAIAPHSVRHELTSRKPRSVSNEMMIEAPAITNGVRHTTVRTQAGTG